MARALAHPQTSVDDLLTALAAERLGPTAAPRARAAWRLFSDALAQYPFNGTVIYTCPVQFGPANLLYAKPTHYAATMIGFPYDDLDRWRGPYPRDVFIAQFQKLSDGWQQGLAELRRAVELASPEHRPDAQRDLRLAEAAGLHFRSVVNQSTFVVARDELADRAIKPEQRRQLESEVRATLQDEIAAAMELFVLTREDSRIGFEASNQYYYLPQDLVEKVIDCTALLPPL